MNDFKAYEHFNTEPLFLLESDPYGLSPHDPGAKLDEGKNWPWLVLGDFANAIDAVVDIGTDGAKKYSKSGWLSVKDGKFRYLNAMFRHIIKLMKGEKFDKDSGSLNLAHIAWCVLAVLELELREENAGNDT